MRTNTKVTLGGRQYWVYVSPVDPLLFDKHAFQYVPTHPNYAPETFPHVAEGVVVKGRNWTIQR